MACFNLLRRANPASLTPGTKYTSLKLLRCFSQSAVRGGFALVILPGTAPQVV